MGELDLVNRTWVWIKNCAVAGTIPTALSPYLRCLLSYQLFFFCSWTAVEFWNKKLPLVQ